MASDRPRRRQRALVAVAFGTAAVSVAGLIASTFVRSPAQVAAQTAAPSPSVITAPVVRQVLQTTVVFRGTVSPSRTVSFTPQAEVAPSGSGPGPGQLVVTRALARAGQQAEAGEVIAEVDYRPVFVLPGAVPALRDLVQGDTGPDVGELQAALAQLGYGSGADLYGVFGSGTAQAVRAFYHDIGYPVPVTPAGGSKPARASQLVEVPMSEVMFVPVLPALIVSVDDTVGSAVSSPLVTIAEYGLALTGQLDPSSAALVQPGMAVQATGPDGTVLDGRVGQVGGLVTPGNGGAAYLPVTVTPDRPWPTSWNGQDIQLSVTRAATAGKVLAVAEAAISASADGSSYVTVVEPGGLTHRVAVRPGASAGGLVQVTPVSGSLSAGEQVEVGIR